MQTKRIILIHINNYAPTKSSCIRLYGPPQGEKRAVVSFTQYLQFYQCSFGELAKCNEATYYRSNKYDGC